MVTVLVAVTAWRLFCSCTVIGSDGWPAAIVCTGETNATDEKDEDEPVTVSCCVVVNDTPLDTLGAIVAVTLAGPLENGFSISKLAELEPAAMMTEDAGFPDASKNSRPKLPAELFSWTKTGLVTTNGLPLLSCNWTVRGPGDGNRVNNANVRRLLSPLHPYARFLEKPDALFWKFLDFLTLNEKSRKRKRRRMARRSRFRLVRLIREQSCL
jgi:hypothetical protein